LGLISSVGVGSHLGLTTTVETKFLRAYEVSVFDTPSQTLEPGTFAVDEVASGYHYLPKGETKWRWTADPKLTAGLTEIHITGKAYYFDSVDPDTGEVYTEKMPDKKAYTDLEKPSPKNPSKTIQKPVSFIPRAHAAVTLNSTTTGETAVNATSLTYSHTNNATVNTGLIVGVSTAAGGAPSVTYAAAAMNYEISFPTSVNDRTGLFSKINPASGANNVVVTVPVSTNILATAYSVEGANQTTLISNTASSSATDAAPSATVTTATGELIIDNLTIDSDKSASLAVGAGQTRQAMEIGTSGLTHAGSSQLGASGGVMSWTFTTNETWGSTVVSIQAAAAAAAAAQTRFLRGHGISR
jgi:hypothetical protein